MEVGRGRSEVGVGEEDFGKKTLDFPTPPFLLNPSSVLSFLWNFEMRRKVVCIADSSLVQFKSSLISSSCESKGTADFFRFSWTSSYLGDGEPVLKNFFRAN